jgi:hypothetical protein
MTMSEIASSSAYGVILAMTVERGYWDDLYDYV